METRIYYYISSIAMVLLLACSNPVSKVEHKPVISSISFDRSQIYVGEFITVQGMVSDQDNDPLKYLWTSDGGTFTNPQNNPTQWHAGTIAGTYTLTLTVSDGTFNVSESRSIKVLAQ